MFLYFISVLKSWFCWFDVFLLPFVYPPGWLGTVINLINMSCRVIKKRAYRCGTWTYIRCCWQSRADTRCVLRDAQKRRGPTPNVHPPQSPVTHFYGGLQSCEQPLRSLYYTYYVEANYSDEAAIDRLAVSRPDKNIYIYTERGDRQGKAARKDINSIDWLRGYYTDVHLYFCDGCAAVNHSIIIPIRRCLELMKKYCMFFMD